MDLLIAEIPAFLYNKTNAVCTFFIGSTPVRNEICLLGGRTQRGSFVGGTLLLQEENILYLQEVKK